MAGEHEPEAAEAATLSQAESKPSVRGLPSSTAGPFRSKALQRIVDEIRCEQTGKDAPLERYNRTYHRHNR